MYKDSFYINNKRSIPLESELKKYNSFDEFEKDFSDEFLNDDCRLGNYLDELIWKYDRRASELSVDAHLNHSYIGNIINGKKNNPSRNVLLCICLALGATIEETQYLLKYAGHAPLYVRKKRDVIIWFGILKNESLDNVNDNLINRNFSPLFNIN